MPLYRHPSAALLLALLPAAGLALSPAPNDADYRLADANIFLQGEVTRAYVTIDPSDFQQLLDDPRADIDKNVTLRWVNSVLDETVTDVAFRPRGGGFTRDAVRKSWKLDFNDFVSGRSFYGLESINLNGDHNDPTLLRRRMAHEILRQMGLPTPRTHFVALYINGDFWSMQIHVEHIDEEFADSWFGSKTGNLYKCLFGQAPADLRKIQGEDYRNHGGGTTYEEVNNAPLSDYTDLVEFIRFINDTTPQERLAGLESRLHIDNFLRYLAANVALGNWDDYWYGSNNYYLYFNPATTRFEWIPYDYDNSLGMDYFSTNWSTRHYEGWGDGGFGSTPAPLVSAVFDHSPWRRQYRRYLDKAARLLVLPANQALLQQWAAQIRPYYDGTIESGGVVGTQSSSGQHDPYFTTGISQPTNWNRGSFHTMGIVPFMNTRSARLLAQLANDFTPPLPRVFINEAMASNGNVIADEFGEFDDWIELYNDETTPVDIGGWHLTDDVANPLKWVIPVGTVIPAKGRLLVWCDNSPLQGPLHAPFALGAGGEHIGLFMNEVEGRVLVDEMAYPPLTVNQSYGRATDGSSVYTIHCTPTPGQPNNNSVPPCGSTEPRTPPRVWINEFMADNDTVVADEAGEFDDWVELYNAEPFPVDLGGAYLTDNLNNRTKWQFPAGTVIPARGFLLIWCDSTPAQGPLHTSWSLSAGGEAIGLFDTDLNNNQPIHTVTFGRQTTDISTGLLPDGVEPFIILTEPSPGRSNVPVTATPEVWLVE